MNVHFLYDEGIPNQGIMQTFKMQENICWQKMHGKGITYKERRGNLAFEEYLHYLYCGDGFPEYVSGLTKSVCQTYFSKAIL